MINIKAIIIIIITVSINVFNCSAQELKKYEELKYKGYILSKTFNKSFINKKLFFLKNKDTIFFNQKLPYNSSKKTFYDYGIYYNCMLQKDTSYSIVLKKVNLRDIPTYLNNYYRINTVFKNKYDSSSYTEIKKNTRFLIKGNNDKYLDINNKIYEIIGLSPPTECGIVH